MKKFVLILILLCALWQPGAAQQVEAPPELPLSHRQTIAAPAPPMNENDRIPFMAEQTAAQNAGAPSSSNLIVRTLGAMCLIVGLIFGAAFILKKFNLVKTNQTGVLEQPDLTVLSNVALGANRTLSVVRFGDQILLVGSTNHTISLISEQSKRLGEIAPRSVSDLLADEYSLIDRDAAFENRLIQAQQRQRRLEAGRSDV